MRPAARLRRAARGLRLSLQLLAAHRLRTALSVCGLLIGVAAVIVMVAVGEGAERRVLERLRGMGTNLLVVNAAPAPRVAGRPRQVDMTTLLRVDDADLLRQSPFSVAAAPVVNRQSVVRWERRNTTTMLTGTTPEGLGIRNIRAAAGRLFNVDDEKARRRVAVIGPTAARSLFAGDDPVGRVVRIGQATFDVIGVTEPRGVDPLGADLDDVLLIPFETAVRRVLNIPYVHAIYLQARNPTDLVALELDVRERLGARLAARAGMREPFVVQNQATLLRTERGAAQAMNRLVVGVAAMALLVGGIGILAVMLISVRERTREIGLRRALGAKRRDIQIQFIVESTLLAVAGGAAGVAAGIVAAGVAAIAGPWDLVLSWRPAALGLVGSALLGLLVGAIPATRAARLEPIEALRAR
jgi:putative ABC transport system permease protein